MKLVNFTNLCRMVFHVQNIKVITSADDLQLLRHPRHVLAFFSAENNQPSSIVYFPKGSELFSPLSKRALKKKKTRRSKAQMFKDEASFPVIIAFDIFDNCFTEFLLFNSVTVIGLKNCDAYFHIFKSIASVSLIEGYSPTRIISILTDLILQMSEEATRISRPLYKDTAIYPAIEYINNHDIATVSVPNLANICNMSVSGFRAKFKASIGVSPIDYISEKKFLMAKEMISKGKSSLAEISTALGFSNVSYFSRFYKERTGHSPSEDIILKKQSK